MTNEQEFIFFGMRRGGQHAVIHWLACHFDEPVWFVNDISKFAKPKVPRDDTNVYAPDAFRTPTNDDAFWKKKKKVFFQSYEDKYIDELDFEANESVVGKSGKQTCVLIMRDPFNMFASRLKAGDFVFRLTKKHVALWIQHAEEAIGATSFLPNLVVISYNDWVTSEKYRRRIENIMGLPETDRGINQIFGVGSSFDAKKYDGRATSMNVLKRWKGFGAYETYRNLVKNGRLWELSRTIFGQVAPDRLRPKHKRDKAKPDSLKGKRLWYIRTPKTASTTIKFMLRGYAADNNMKVLYRSHESVFAELEAPFDVSLHHLVHKEKNVNRMKELMPGHVVITSVRDPLQRARSHYNHISPAGPVNEFAKQGVPYHEWYLRNKGEEGKAAGWKNPKELRHFTNNVMALFMGYYSMDELHFDLFARRYAFVFVAEEMELSWKVFSALVGWKANTIEKMRVAAYDKSPVPPEVEQAFRERNELDYAIYDFGKMLLKQQAEELGIG